MLLHNTAAVLLIMLGFVTLGVWHEQDSSIIGAENFADFLKRESSNVIKSEEQYPIFVSKCGIPSQMRDFIMQSRTGYFITISFTHVKADGCREL